MTVDDCIAEYKNLAGEIFGKPRIFHQTRLSMLFLTRPKYNTDKLQRVIQDVIGRRAKISAPDDDDSKFETAKDTCRT